MDVAVIHSCAMNRDTFGIVSAIVQSITGIAAAVFALVGYLQPQQHTFPRWARALCILVGGVILVLGIRPLLHAYYPIRLLRVHVEEINPATVPQPTFKPKVRMELRNDSERCLDIEMQGWEERKDGIPLRSNQPHTTWQEFDGKVWTPSPNAVAELHVRPGVRFRTWLVFDVNLGEADLKQRISKKQLGTLAILASGRILKVKT